MKILILEDSDEVLFVLKEILNPALDITYVTDFLEFQKFIETCTPDILITDWNFPHGNGDQVAKIARAKGVKHIFLNSDYVKYDETLYDGVLEKMSLTQIPTLLKKFS